MPGAGFKHVMPTYPVISTCLEEADYDEVSGSLILSFDDGSVYLYEDVPGSIVSALLASESKGVFFNASIRPAGYSNTRLN